MQTPISLIDEVDPGAVPDRDCSKVSNPEELPSPMAVEDVPLSFSALFRPLAGGTL